MFVPFKAFLVTWFCCVAENETYCIADNSDKNCWDNCGQSSYAMSLYAGLAPSEAAGQAALQALVDDIVTAQQNHITCGVLGCKALFNVLQGMGRVQVGVDLAEQTTQVGGDSLCYCNN